MAEETRSEARAAGAPEPEKLAKPFCDWKTWLGYTGIVLSVFMGTLTGITFLLHLVQIAVFGAPLGVDIDLSGNLLYAYAIVFLVNLIPIFIVGAVLFVFSRWLKTLMLRGWRKWGKTPLPQAPYWGILTCLLLALFLVFVAVNSLGELHGLFWLTEPLPKSVGILPLVLNPYRGERPLVLTASLAIFVLSVCLQVRLVRAMRCAPEYRPFGKVLGAGVVMLFSFLAYLYMHGALLPDIGHTNIPHVRVHLQASTPSGVEIRSGYFVDEDLGFLTLMPEPQDTSAPPLYVFAQDEVKRIDYLGEDEYIDRLLCIRLSATNRRDICATPVRFKVGPRHLSFWTWILSVYGFLMLAFMMMVPVENAAPVPPGATPKEVRRRE